MSDEKLPRRQVWYGQCADFHDWSPERRERVLKFITAHGFTADQIPLGTDKWHIARVDGQLMLSIWVHDHTPDGKVQFCPHCPNCVKLREVIVPLVAYPPRLDDQWTTQEPELRQQLWAMPGTPDEGAKP